MMLKKLALIFAMFLLVDATAQKIDMSLIPYRHGDKWGYAGQDKEILIKPQYQDASWFSEGLAAVKIGNKWGYINRLGKLVIPAKYTVAKSFRKGYMPNENKTGGDSLIFAGVSLRPDGYEICINAKGVTMPKCPAIPESSVEQNRIPVESVTRIKTYNVPNSEGLFDKIIDDYRIEGSDETYYIAIKNDRFGVFNSKFETIVPFQYDSIKINKATKIPFLQVKQNGMYGIVAINGNVAIQPNNTRIMPVTTKSGDEYLIIQHEGKTYLRDMNNKDIIKQGYADIVYDPAGGFVVTGDNNLRGYYFMDNSSIPPKYTDVKLLDGTHFLQIKTSSGKVGYISSTGSEYFDE